MSIAKKSHPSNEEIAMQTWKRMLLYAVAAVLIISVLALVLGYFFNDFIVNLLLFYYLFSQFLDWSKISRRQETI